MTSPLTSLRNAAAERRSQRLQLAVRWSGRWLIAQGLLGCLMTEWLTQHVSLRWQDLMVPYIHQSGAAMLALGLLVNAGLKSPRQQAMAVDTLILCLLAQSYFLLSYRLAGHEINSFEWFSLLLNLGLGSALTFYRTRSTEMDPDSAGPLLTLPVAQMTRHSLAWFQARLKGRPAPPVAQPKPKPVEAPAPAAMPAQDPAAAPAEKPAKRSEALPRMD